MIKEIQAYVGKINQAIGHSGGVGEGPGVVGLNAITHAGEVLLTGRW